MLWVFIALSVLVAIGSAFGNTTDKGHRRKSAPSLETRTSSGMARLPSGKPAYAEREQEGHYIIMTSEEVTALFAPFRSDLKKHRATGSKARKVAERYEDSGLIKEGARASIETDLAQARLSTIEATEIYDALFFDRESSAEKHYKLIDELDDAEAEIEDALAEIDATADVIATGKFLPRHPQ